jgi:ATP-binding cassette subfamily B protein RaxB
VGLALELIAIDSSKRSTSCTAPKLPILAIALKAATTRAGIASLALAGLSYLFQAAIPLLMGLSVNELGHSSRDMVSAMGMLFTLLSVTSAMTSVVADLASKVTANALSVKVGTWLFDRLAMKGASYFDRHPAAHALTQLSALTTLEVFYARLASRILNVSILAVSGLFAMLYISPWIILISVGFALVGMLVDYITREPLQRRLSLAFKAAVDVRSLMVEAIPQLPACARYGVVQRLKARVRGKLRARHVAEMSCSRLDSGRSGANTVIKTLDQLLFVCIAGYFMQQGKYGLGTFVAAGAFKDQLASAIGALFQLWREHELLRPHRLTIAELQSDGNKKPQDDSRRRVLAEPGVVLKDVSFSYGRFELAVLHNAHARIGEGEFAVVFGASGSGKTTLVRLICGELEPLGGHITVGGLVPAIGTLGIGTVLQTDRLLTDTIRANVTFFRAGITDEQIIAALEFAELKEVVDAMPLRLNTPVGEAIGGLSGGQRQRLLLARAVVGNPKLLLLDESTSSLDVAREAAILARLKRSRVTVVVCSHRPEVWAHADRLFEIVGGRIVERGANVELAPSRSTATN